MKTVVVPDGLDQERADVAVARLLGLSRNAVADIAGAGGIRADNRSLSKADRLHSGALLEIDLPEPAAGVAPHPKTVSGVGICYDDDDIVVVDKPVGVAAHPSLGWNGPSVTEHLAGAGFRIATSGAPERQGVVQRLDVGTSGLMVVAKSELAYSVLKQAFRDRRVDKTYHTLVQGHPDPFTGTIDAPIGRHPGPEYKMAVVSSGRPSVTHYRMLEVHRAATLLEVKTETGRTHQIRVHMAAVSHPCVGDPMYGPNPALAQELGLVRQWLHAVGLGFAHPAGGEQLTFTSCYPADLEAALETVRTR
jgi:23S rRNA pseudouridine1911/1915/1917 synthase